MNWCGCTIGWAIPATIWSGLWTSFGFTCYGCTSYSCSTSGSFVEMEREVSQLDIYLPHLFNRRVVLTYSIEGVCACQSVWHEDVCGLYSSVLILLIKLGLMSSVNVSIVIYLALTLLIEGESECLTCVCVKHQHIIHTIQLHLLEFRLNLTLPYKTGL